SVRSRCRDACPRPPPRPRPGSSLASWASTTQCSSLRLLGCVSRQIRYRRSFGAAPVAPVPRPAAEAPVAPAGARTATATARLDGYAAVLAGHSVSLLLLSITASRSCHLSRSAAYLARRSAP